jgi:hypothetical protein
MVRRLRIAKCLIASFLRLSEPRIRSSCWNQGLQNGTGRSRGLSRFGSPVVRLPLIAPRVAQPPAAMNKFRPGDQSLPAAGPGVQTRDGIGDACTSPASPFLDQDQLLVFPSVSPTPFERPFPTNSRTNRTCMLCRSHQKLVQ